ncbi:hypothetical protein AB0M32_16840 [Streptomyces sp. NPDC051985]|uniref:hypothetical protein n=1 Tax=Streptomyces sp. NPDC051985 TaxID=3155807 RepID=UPI003422A8FF
MPDRITLVPAPDRITAGARALCQALRAHAPDNAHALAARITDTQQLAGTALRLFLDLTQHAPRPSPEDLLVLDQVAQIAKAAQNAAAELTAALARAVENQRRQADAASTRVVLIGPSPQQFIESATGLLGRIPALAHAIPCDRLIPPSH